jgi:c-di-GMP-binding flagellar brake protein YcgR
MSFHYETARRDFVRIPTNVPVRYKFLSKTIEVGEEGIFEGYTCAISGTGLLLYGRLPGWTWIPGLLMQEILLGVNVLLPAHDETIKALASVAWVESIKKGSETCPMGLRFQEVSKEHQDLLLKYVIKAQLAR